MEEAANSEVRVVTTELLNALQKVLEPANVPNRNIREQAIRAGDCLSRNGSMGGHMGFNDLDGAEWEMSVVNLEGAHVGLSRLLPTGEIEELGFTAGGRFQDYEYFIGTATRVEEEIGGKKVEKRKIEYTDQQKNNSTAASKGKQLIQKLDLAMRSLPEV